MKTTISTSVIIIFLMNAMLAVATAVGMTIAPFILVENIGISLLMLGLIEGLLEMSGSLIKLISGIAFDKIKNVKYLFLTSAVISFFAKLLLFFPSSLSIVFSKGFERISNGMFATPRDAYVLENTKNRGFSYGLLNASKTLGCVMGSALVGLAVYISGETLEYNMSFILLISCSFSALAILLSIFIKNNGEQKRSVEKSFNFDVAKTHFLTCIKDKKMQLKLLPIYIGAFVFFLGRFNDGVLMFYLKDMGKPSWIYLSTISMFNTCMFVAAPMLGMLIDKKYTKIVFCITIFSLLLFDLVFSSLSELPNCFVFIGLALWGIQRTGAAIIFAYLLFQKSDNKHVYGTNLGILLFIMGLGSLFGSIIAGYLSSIDFQYVFLFSGVCASLASITGRYIR